MVVWQSILVMFVAGLVGGLGNALLVDRGLRLPRKEGDIWQPGFLGNMVIGGLAAVLMWGLYTAGQAVLTGNYTPSVQEIVGSIVAGLGGARVLTAELDKQLLRKTAVDAATAPASPELAAIIGTAPPADALRAAREARV
jgi:hypothetical protein